MVFAHISDVHVLDLAGVSAARYLNKRLSGLLNLALKRRNAHPIALLEAVVDDLIARPGRSRLAHRRPDQPRAAQRVPARP